MKWDGCSYSENSSIPKDTLMLLGFDKLMQRVDEREAQSQGAYNRPLTQVNIEKQPEACLVCIPFGPPNMQRGFSSDLLFTDLSRDMYFC